MRIRSLITAVLILAGAPLLAQNAQQSYITYDDSDSVLVQDDGKEVDARVNLPVYPGDEVRAAQRGRTELRLADGNVVALDRDSAVRFKSMLLNFEEGGEQTVVELIRGQVVVYRRYEGSEPLRLDSPNASFIAERESIYGVETNSRGVDVATVFQGSVEVRTPKGSQLLNAGDRVKIDVTGVYDRRAISNVSATEFERWFLARAERYANKESRHLDASLAYAEDDLNENGRWVYVKDYDTWAWSPYVSTGWRPYYHGYWGWGANGSCWISDEPWGWVPYHYGNWSYVNYYGWIWFPGQVYAPAWVYWAWGPTWVGWVPWGYYSYYPGYYNWLYDPHCDPHVYGQYGFHGGINVNSGDLSAYTVVDSRTLFSNRADRAALTADAVRDRLTRDGGRATLTNQPTRVTRADLRDPSTVVDRIIRGGRDGSGTGSVGAGSSGDLTQFFQRDPALSQDVKNRVTTRGKGERATTTTSSRPGSTLPSGGTTSSTASSTPTSPRGGRGTGGGTVARPSTSGSTTSGSTTSSGSTSSSAGPRGGGSGTLPRGGGSTSGGSTSSGGSTTSGGSSSSGGSSAPTTSRPRDGGSAPRNQDTQEPAEASPRGGNDNSSASTVERPGGGNASSSGSGDWRVRGVRLGTGVTGPGSTTAGSSSSGGATSSGPRTVIRGGSRDPVSRPSTSGSSTSATQSRGVVSGDSWRGGTGETVRRVIGSIGGARLSPSGSSSSGSAGRSGGSGSTSHRGSGGSGTVSRPSSGSSGSSSSSGSSGSSHSSGGGSSSGSSGSSHSSGGSSSSPRSGGGGGTIHRGGR